MVTESDDWDTDRDAHIAPSEGVTNMRQHQVRKPARTGEDPAAVIPFPRQHEVAPDELRDAFDQYRGVMARIAGGAEPTPAIAAARSALTRVLIRDGWEPPPSVFDQLRQDEQLLAGSLASASAS